MNVTQLMPGAGAALLLILASCGAGSGSDSVSGPFDFQTTRTVDLEVSVLLDGAPAEGAIVKIVDVLRPQPSIPIEDVTLGGFYGTFRSGADGLATGTVRFPDRVQEVDVVVTLPGARGPLSEESLRDFWGPFTPAARVHTSLANLRGLQLDLTEAL